MHPCVCVYVCVRVQGGGGNGTERETEKERGVKREREKETELGTLSDRPQAYKHLPTLKQSETDRERESSEI